MAQAAAEVDVRHIVYPGAAEVEGLDFPMPSSHTLVYDAIAGTGVPVRVQGSIARRATEVAPAVRAATIATVA